MVENWEENQALGFTIMKSHKRINSDLLVALAAYRIWNLLAFQDIRQRYRRSVLGPFWITISMVISIGAIGVVYSKIFKLDIEDYLPYLTVGFVVWSFISSIVVESTGVIVSAESIIKQVKLPLGIYVLRMVWRNLIILCHHIPVILAVMVIFNINVGFNIFLLPIAVLITVLGGVFTGYLLGIVCARFRDVGQIVTSLMQVIFYVTPVIWKADLLKNNKWLLDFNPFYPFLAIMRFSLMGGDMDWQPWIFSIFITLFLGLLAAIVVNKTSSRLALWI